MPSVYTCLQTPCDPWGWQRRRHAYAICLKCNGPALFRAAGYNFDTHKFYLWVQSSFSKILVGRLIMGYRTKNNIDVKLWSVTIKIYSSWMRICDFSYRTATTKKLFSCDQGCGSSQIFNASASSSSWSSMLPSSLPFPHFSNFLLPLPAPDRISCFRVRFPFQSLSSNCFRFHFHKNLTASASSLRFHIPA